MSKTIKTQNIRSLIKTAMSDRKWTVYKLAKESGVSVSSLYKWFDKKKSFHIDTISSDNVARLLAALDLVIVRQKQIDITTAADTTRRYLNMD